MDVADVKRQIVQKQLDSFYIFTGDELELMWTYIRKIAETVGKKLRYEDDYATVVKSSRTQSIIKQSYVYVLRDDQTLLKDEKLWRSVADMQTGNILILLLSSVDKRTKFYKTFSDRIVQFEPMTEPVLIKYVKKYADMPENACKRLISLCNGNLGQILLELDKIVRYAKMKSLTATESFKYLLDAGLIYEPPRDMVFEFAKQFLLRKPVATFQLMQECLDGGEAVLVMLTVLYSSARQLLQVMTCDSKDVERVTGLTAWQIRNVQDLRGHFSGKELVNILQTIRKVETGIKTGEVEEAMAIPYLLSCTQL